MTTVIRCPADAEGCLNLCRERFQSDIMPSSWPIVMTFAEGSTLYRSIYCEVEEWAAEEGVEYHFACNGPLLNVGFRCPRAAMQFKLRWG